MVVDATKEKKAKEFEMADKVGIKKQMIESMQYVIQQYPDGLPKSFGPDELYFMFDQGMTIAGVKPEFEIKSIFQLFRAFLHGYSMGKAMSGE